MAFNSFLVRFYILILTLSLIPTANALLLYSSPDFVDALSSNSGRVSDTNWSGIDSKTAAGFSLSENSNFGLVNNVSFVGTDERFFSSPLGFTIRFYDQSGDVPNLNPFYEYSTNTYATFASGSLATEVFNLDIAPVLLSTGLTYYFSVQANHSSNDWTWGWSDVVYSTNTYDTYWIDDRYSNWNQANFDLSMGFQLYGRTVSVPEPPSSWLLGVGLIALIGLSKRKHNKLMTIKRSSFRCCFCL